MNSVTNILVATDFTPVGNAAVDYAIATAQALSARVHLLHVSEPSAALDPFGMIELRDLDRAERRAHARLQQRVDDACGTGGVEVDCSVEVGPPAAEILRSAERLQADMIVLGTHGRDGLQRALLGSVAESVLRRAHCPVLVVRSTVLDQRE